MTKQRSFTGKGLDSMISKTKAKTKVALAQVRDRAFDRMLISMFSRPEQALRGIYKRSPFSAERVLVNYTQGFVCLGKRNSKGLEWRFYPKRAVILPSTAKVPKRLRSTLRKKPFDIQRSRDFDGVILACRRQNTWINDDVVALYQELAQRGKIETVEAYCNDRLVGGLWGLVVQGNFALMSMFHRVDNAGSVVLATLVQALQAGEYRLIDCGQLNPNFRRYGAVELVYDDFVHELAKSHFGEENANEPPKAGQLQIL